MALQDLKSNLSNYRKPKVKVSLSQRVTPTPESFTTTPLSDKVESLATKPGKIEQTPTKVGTTPTKVKQGDKFKGETLVTMVNLTVSHSTCLKKHLDQCLRQILRTNFCEFF